MKERPAHATEPVDEPDRTLCGHYLERPAHLEALKIDDANPTCRACLRIIGARLRGSAP
jgi:hypothetical protein